MTTPTIAKTSHVTRRRSAAKALSWRTVGCIDTFLLTYLITGELKYGAFVATGEVITKLILYYIHERAWAHVRWGLKHPDQAAASKEKISSS